MINYAIRVLTSMIFYFADFLLISDSLLIYSTRSLVNSRTLFIFSIAYILIKLAFD